MCFLRECGELTIQSTISIPSLGMIGAWDIVVRDCIIENWRTDGNIIWKRNSAKCPLDEELL